MNYNLEIQKILLEINELNSYEDKVTALKKAIQFADAHNDIEKGFDLRLDLIRYEHNTSKCIESYQAFAWLLNTSDTNQDLFDESEFLWEYKWMLACAARNSAISKEQIYDISEDLKKRLLKNGYSERAYHNIMMHVHLYNREVEEAKKSIELADAEIIDNMTSCPACELNVKVEVALLEKNFDQAIVLAQDLIQGKLSCYAMPFETYCYLSFYLMLSGDDRASIYFDKALEEYSKNKDYGSSFIYDLSLLIYYMYKTQYPDVWTYFEKVSGWEIDAEDIYKFEFAKYVLSLTNKEGEKKLNLSSKLPYYKTDGIYDLKELHKYYYNQAKEYADKFDLRNGNNNFNKELEVYNK